MKPISACFLFQCLPPRFLRFIVFSGANSDFIGGIGVTDFVYFLRKKFCLLFFSISSCLSRLFFLVFPCSWCPVSWLSPLFGLCSPPPGKNNHPFVKVFLVSGFGTAQIDLHFVTAPLSHHPSPPVSIRIEVSKVHRKWRFPNQFFRCSHRLYTI